MDGSAAQKDLQAAVDAIKKGRFDEADEALNRAAHDGGDPMRISDLGRQLRFARLAREGTVAVSVRIGFVIALIGYLIVSTRQPEGWKPGIWLMLILGVVPAVAGIFVGWRHAGERSVKFAFVDGFRASVFAMMLYSAANLIVLFDHLHKDYTQVGDEFFAAATTIVLFSIGAGVISGGISVVASHLLPRGAAR